MPHILQSSKLEDDTALFALALGPANRTSIALCGGGQRGFADVSLLYGVWHALRLPVSLITTPGLERYVPAGVPFAVSSTENGDSKSSSAWRLLDSAGLVVVGPNMLLTSSEQVFYARLLPHSTVPTVLTDEALSLWDIDQAVRENPRVTWLVSTRRAEKVQTSNVPKINSSRGVFGVEEFMRSLPLKSDFFMLYDALHLYSYVVASDTIIVSPLHGSEKLVRNLVLSLLPVTVFARTRGVALEERLKVLHYVFSLLGEQYIRTPNHWSAEIRRALS